MRLDSDATEALQFISSSAGDALAATTTDPLTDDPVVLCDGPATSERSSSVNDSVLLLDSRPRLVGASWVSVEGIGDN